MKNYSIITFIFFILFDIGISQNSNPSKIENIKKNRFEIELNYLGLAFYYNRMISNRFSIGTSIGFGRGSIGFLVTGPDNYPNVLADYFDICLLSNYHLSKHIKFEGGFKAALSTFGENDICDDCGNSNFSIFLSVVGGLKHFKLGSRLNLSKLIVGNSNPNLVLVINPVFLRYNF